MEPAARSAPANISNLPLHDAISQRAREIWEQSGRVSGRDEEFWLTAEREILGADAGAKAEGHGTVSSNQLAESTDANHAKRDRRR
jgi:DUF2934 family protein